MRKKKSRPVRQEYDGKLADIQDFSIERFSNLDANIQQRINRIRAETDVLSCAVMPDVHLAGDFCVGTVIAARNRIFVEAVGSDLGCGMAALAFDVEANLIRGSNRSELIINDLKRIVPGNRHGSRTIAKGLPDLLVEYELSSLRLEKIKRREGRVQFGTLGRGNHFLEFQSDQNSQLWLMIHSGSRGIGHAIFAHHLAIANSSRLTLRNGRKQIPSFLVDTEQGKDYLHDASWGFQYAAENRKRMAELVANYLEKHFRVKTDWGSFFQADHNHVVVAPDCPDVWIHRKGAQSAREGESGMIPGTMSTKSFHTEGRGNPHSLYSSSHGAGRRMSRKAAFEKLTISQLRSQMRHVLFDEKNAHRLLDESAGAYRDIRAVMKAQKRLTKIVRELIPILNYKAV